MADLDGGCACGTVRYRLHGAPMFVHCCHCTDCQRESGSAFVLNALYEADRVERLAGGTEAIVTPSASGKGQTIHRCPECRIALWSHYAGADEAVAFVRVGTLDQAGALVPDVHIYTRSKLAWVMLPEGAPAMEGYYSPKQLWPEDSQHRWKAAKG